MQQHFNAASLLYQLVPRSSSRGNRYISPRMEDDARMCPSPLVPYSAGPMQSADVRSLSGSSCPSMAESVVVPTTGEDANRQPHPSSTRGRGCRTLSKLRLPSGSSPSSISRLQGLRLRLKAEGMPEEAVTLILASWRSKTDMPTMILHGRSGRHGSLQEIPIPFRQICQGF